MSNTEIFTMVAVAVAILFVWTMLFRTSARGGG